jgi:hypothetical protein
MSLETTKLLDWKVEHFRYKQRTLRAEHFHRQQTSCYREFQVREI